MALLRPLSALSAVLLSLSITTSALALGPGLVTRSGRFATSALAPGQRATNAQIEQAAVAVAQRELAWSRPLAFGAARTTELTQGERVVKLPQLHGGLPVAM